MIFKKNRLSYKLLFYKHYLPKIELKTRVHYAGY